MDTEFYHFRMRRIYPTLAKSDLEYRYRELDLMAFVYENLQGPAATTTKSALPMTVITILAMAVRGNASCVMRHAVFKRGYRSPRYHGKPDSTASWRSSSSLLLFVLCVVSLELALKFRSVMPDSRIGAQRLTMPQTCESSSLAMGRCASFLGRHSQPNYVEGEETVLVPSSVIGCCGMWCFLLISLGC